MKQPPGPKGHFLWGSGMAAIETPLTLYESAWKEFGDCVRLTSIPGYYWYLFTHPTAVEHVLQTHQQNFRKPDVFNRPMSLLVGNGLVVSEGALWMRQRRLAQPAFHKTRLALLAQSMVDTTIEHINNWEKLTTESVIDIADEMGALTLDIVGKALFSTDLHEYSERVGTTMRIALEHVNYRMGHAFSLPEWVPTKRNRQFLKAKAELDSVVMEIISKRRQSGIDENDLLSALLRATDDESGESMSNELLRDEVITLMLAGHDTTAAALTWTWYLLSLNPDKEAILLDELKSALGGRMPSVEDLPNLPYTRMVIEESLRLYPPAWGIIREAKEDEEIGGYIVRKGRPITLVQYITHKHPEFWEEPHAFMPERFEKDKVAQRPKFAYFPFGGGQRACIGKEFSLMEATLALAAIAQKLKFIPLPNQNIDPDPTFTLRPRYGIKAHVLKRDN
ncbi:MAG: cytochrome P450 [Candidatus Obscuribacterales bacterium]|nr:cytochrome P450 [Candidatus Obscuribacterales bacterium]